MNESYGQAKYAIVKEYHPENCCVKVGWYDVNEDSYDTMISGWLPITTPFLGMGDDTGGKSGNLWGMVAPPNIGQPVVVISQHGDWNNGIVVGGTYAPDMVTPPQVDGKFPQNGEFLIIHKKGEKNKQTYIYIQNDGDITIFANHDINLHAEHNINISINGDAIFAVNGQLAVKAKSVLLQGSSQVMLDAPLTKMTGTASVSNGAIGRFETTDGKVVTVENGIVTNIV